MADAETSAETVDVPPAPEAPVSPTISVTRMLEPPAFVEAATISPSSATDPSSPVYRPPPTDATPVISPEADTDNAATRVQTVKPAAARPAGVPDIPGYEIIAEIGRGGMGVVYKARQLDLNRTVALKMILGEYERPEQLMRFRIEAETAARVRHANVVQVYDSGTSGGRPYLVLEWVDGGTLGSCLKGKPQSPRTSARTLSLLARALHATHCAGIVHRDLKPGNVLVARTTAAATQTGTHTTATTSRPDALAVTLTVDGQPVGIVPKVTDFGLAKEMASDTNLTETGRVLGTPEYMAPEQAKGKQRDIGPPTDVYALGVILYQMLTGRTPFHDTSAIVIMRRVVEEEPKSPRTLQPKLPRDLETICLKCLNKDPARRYPTAEALANDLDAFIDGHPIAARPTGSFERAWKWAGRRPAVATLAATTVLFFVLGFAGVTWKWREAEAAKLAALTAENQVRTEKATTDAVNHFLLDDLLATAAPEKQLGRKVTVKEVLDNASARIGGRFAEQPEVAAAVRLVLGNSYRKLGDLEPADRHLKTAVDLRRKQLGETHPETLAALSDRGLLLADQGNWKDALPLMKKVVADASGAVGQDNPLTIEATDRLALVVEQAGELAEAEPLFKQALDTSRRTLGPDAERTLTVLNDYGTILWARRKLPEAEAAFREAANRQAKILTPAHPATLKSMANLAAVLDDEGRWQEAKPIYEKVLVEKRRVLPPDHSDTLSTMNNLAFVLRQHGEWEAALPLYDEAYEGCRKTMGGDNPETLKMQNGLGQFHVLFGAQRGRPDLITRGVTILEAVLETRRRVLPPDHPETLVTLTDLGAALVAEKKFDEAEPLLKEALAGRRKKLGPGNLDTLDTAINYVRCLQGGKKTAEAVAEGRSVLAAAEKDGNAETRQGVQLLSLLAESIVKDQPDEAAKLADRAYALSRKLFGETAGETMRNCRRLYIALMNLDRLAEAEALLRAMHDACRAAGDNSHTADAALDLGACLARQKRYADAEPLFIEAYDAATRIPNVSPDAVRKVGERVAQLYQAWGKPDKAAEWREKVK